MTSDSREIPMQALSLLLAVITINCLGAEPPLGESELVDLVSQSLYSDHDDSRLAEHLGRLQINKKLREATVAELERLSLGPLSLTALKDLQQRSQNLPASGVPSISREPVPSAGDQDQMIRELKQYGSAYVHSLPNFLCEEVTERYSNLHGRAASGNVRYSKQPRHADTLKAQLAFAPRLQQDRVSLASDAESNRKKLGQSISTGEFGREWRLFSARLPSPS